MNMSIHDHEQFMEHEGERTMYHDYPPPHEYPHNYYDDFPRPHHGDYPYDKYPRGHLEFIRYHHSEDLHAIEFLHFEYRHPHDDFGPPSDSYSPSQEFFYERPGGEFEEHFSDQHSSQREKVSGERTEGSEFGIDAAKRPNLIAVPSASSVDLALLNSQHMQTLRRLAHHPPTPTKVPMSPACFPHLAVAATRILPSSSCGREDIQIPLPNAMSFGKIEQRATKGHEVNEVGVEDHRTNPVEKLVAL